MPGVGAANGVWLNRMLLFFLVDLVLLVPIGSCRNPIYDPISKRIRIIYLGDSWGTASAFPTIAKDPVFMATPVPASEMHLGGIPHVGKFLRIYMPRTFSDFISFYDIVILSDTQSFVYTVKQLSWFKRGVEERGQGLFMAGGREIQLGAWDGTSVEEVLPGTFLGTQTYEGRPFRAIPTDPDSDFAKALPFGEMPPYLGMIVFNPKDGSDVMFESSPNRMPVLLYHDFGKGSSMIHAPDWTPGWGWMVFEWEYFGDYVGNMLRMLAGHLIPQDPALMHSLREQFGEYEVMKDIIINLIEFVDKFGAKTRVLEQRLEKMTELRSKASELYLANEFDSAVSNMQDLREEMNLLQEHALQLKDQALVWVYITEVLVVTGTSLLCGATLWLLMVKRRLYKEVGLSRGRR